MDFIDTYGLTNSRKDEENAENALLWTAEHILLEEMANKPSEARIAAFKLSVDKCRVRPGIYHQNPSFAVFRPVNEHDAYMSPDQLIAITGMSYKYGWNFHKEIWEEIKRQKLRYDNVNPDSPTRFIHPRDLIFYGYCAGNNICKMLLPLLCIAMFISCLREERKTSGKLLSFVKCNLLKDSWLMRLAWIACTLAVKYKNGSWWEVFNIYFPDQDHPCNKLSREVF